VNTTLTGRPTLSQHRLGRGWSQAHLATLSGVSRTEISAIETGRLVPSVSVALRLGAALATSVELLFGEPSAAPALTWAWPSAAPDDPRVWRASVGDKLLVYPVEATAAGVIPHDGLAGAAGIDVVSAGVAPDRTLVMAGCDPLVGLIVQMAAEQHGIRVLPLLRSSGQALDLLRQGLVHVAGIHLTDASGHATNDRVAHERLGRGYGLIHQLRWEAGIAVAPGRRERTARALLRANVRWVNREEGSAARTTFDRLLGTQARPKGYQRVVHDHQAVAATVASGWAEAGVCIRPVAMEARIGFIALQQESYELCVPQALLDDPRVRALSATLQSVRYRQCIASVPGCVSTDTGAERIVK
jgi:molybdate-binding protein/transcriptional regulator with XRE-family HTH domain